MANNADTTIRRRRCIDAIQQSDQLDLAARPRKPRGVGALDQKRIRAVQHALWQYLEVVPHTEAVSLLEVVVEFVLCALAVDVFGSEAECVQSLAAANLPAALEDEVAAEV